MGPASVAGPGVGGGGLVPRAEAHGSVGVVAEALSYWWLPLPWREHPVFPSPLPQPVRRPSRPSPRRLCLASLSAAERHPRLHVRFVQLFRAFPICSPVSRLRPREPSPSRSSLSSRDALAFAVSDPRHCRQCSFGTYFLPILLSLKGTATCQLFGGQNHVLHLCVFYSD